MKLIEEINVDGIEYKFYNGMDIDSLINHPKDGSNGFIFCFIDNWVNEVRSYERQKKLESVLNSVLNDGDLRCFKLEEFDNSYLAIYQTDGVGIEQTYRIIKDKVLNRNFTNLPYIPIAGITKGAWKIEKPSNLN